MHGEGLDLHLPPFEGHLEPWLGVCTYQKAARVTTHFAQWPALAYRAPVLRSLARTLYIGPAHVWLQTFKPPAAQTTTQVPFLVLRAQPLQQLRGTARIARDVPGQRQPPGQADREPLGRGSGLPHTNFAERASRPSSSNTQANQARMLPSAARSAHVLACISNVLCTSWASRLLGPSCQ